MHSSHPILISHLTLCLTIAWKGSKVLAGERRSDRNKVRLLSASLINRSSSCGPPVADAAVSETSASTKSKATTPSPVHRLPASPSCSSSSSSSSPSDSPQTLISAMTNLTANNNNINSNKNAADKCSVPQQVCHETCVLAKVPGQVMIRNDHFGGWLPHAGGGLSEVSIIRCCCRKKGQNRQSSSQSDSSSTGNKSPIISHEEECESEQFARSSSSSSSPVTTSLPDFDGQDEDLEPEEEFRIIAVRPPDQKVCITM